jgi:hypothetical protein
MKKRKKGEEKGKRKCTFIYLVFFSFPLSITTRFHNFTDENIPSVCDYEFVGNLFTNIFTDEIRPSTFLSSVIPHSVAISVGNTKKPFADGFTDGICAQKKKVSRLKYTDGFYPVGDSVIYRRTYIVSKFVSECLKYRPKISVCKYVGNCDSYCQMPTNSFRR